MTYKIDNNTKIVTYNNEEFYPKLVNGILIAPTEQECIVEKNRREEAKLETTEYESNKYQRDRANDYPSIQEQLDMQYWDKINGTNKWQQAINAVKQKYPK